ncbi:MAG: 30S ribosomal protein S16 [Candidatus Paceibacterota bacterium]|jgi:small subunit ribosomal protein S16
MLMIRFQRVGRTNDPAFRIALLEKSRAAKAGSITEQLGTYNPKSKALTLNEARVKEWIAKGARPTDSIRNLLIAKGVIEGKKVNVLPKKSPQKSEKAIAAEAAAAEAAKAAVVAAEATAIAEAKAAAEASVVETPTEAEIEAEALPAAPTLEEVAAPTESVDEEVAAA